jgi:DNA (cytosine-5)-methyltransferase 1
MFPAMMAAIRALRPPAVLIENVPGLLRGRLERYFDYLLLQLRFPAVERKRGEKWASHLVRLRHLSHRPADGLTYDVHDLVLQAADFGVPQRRERVFIVAFRGDLKAKWDFPPATHSLDALLWDQWVSGEYWKRHYVPPRLRPAMPAVYANRLERLKNWPKPTRLPWRTIRDAILGLPLAVAAGKEPEVPNHVLVPGARVYPKHTGSPLDMPSKTLKAGDHGVPGGENVLVTPDGAVRYFTIRECARLQTFPDDYAFVGTWKTLVRQIGNAVPVMLVERIAAEIFRQLAEHDAKGVGSAESVMVSLPTADERLPIQVH